MKPKEIGTRDNERLAASLITFALEANRYVSQEPTIFDCQHAGEIVKRQLDDQTLNNAFSMFKNMFTRI